MSKLSSHPHAVIYQTPDPGALYDDILLWRFLNYFSQNAASRTWTSKLPQLTSAKNAAAMKAAARAVSLAFAAQNTGNVSMAAAACESYGNSLRYHQASFVAPTGKSICKKKAINALPVTVLLSYFEMIQATSPEAWLEHTAAAERLFVILGKEALKDHLLNHLYYIVRSNSAIRCFLHGAKTVLLEQTWSEVPVAIACGKGTAIFNHLVDLVLWLSNDLGARDGVSSNKNGLTYTTLTLQHTLDDLVQLWESFGDTVGLDTAVYPLLASEPHLVLPYVADAATTTTSIESSVPPLPIALQEPSAALTAGFHHAATILVLVLLQRQAPSSPYSYYTIFNSTSPSSIAHHGNRALASALYLERQGIGCSCLRMMLPLTVVYRFSPDSGQRILAEKVFRRWSTHDGLAGLGAVAFGSGSGNAFLGDEGAREWAGRVVEPEMERLMRTRDYRYRYSPPEEWKGM
ncbi:hypothetical protein H2198_004731 [Neophaeococcomyces mojaviensis]|uniref:Uncharacterized protein n=1 Tax=Neophaeococcomyces mojaviensis TaxID=3383035 RepID=A0ACC3A7Q5_9EURO|nr:hypothetical protein H2198_004731 [Knufia sp. JES_112]